MSHRSARRFGAVIVAVAVGLMAGAAAAQPKKPRAVFKSTARDFGKVKQGDVLTHEFVFKNEGGAPLVIERVESTCGCTAALVSEQTIAPGKEGRVKVAFDTRGYMARLTRYIYVHSNDPADPRTELSVSADIEVPPSARIDVDRYNVEMGLVLEGETPGAKVVVRSAGERELKVELAHETIKFFSGGRPLNSPFFLPAGESREVEIRFPAQVKTGPVRDYILLKSNDPVRSTLSIYVSRYVVSRKELKELFEKYGSVLRDRD